MKLAAHGQPSKFRVTCWVNQGARISAIAALVITLGACSGFRVADDSPRQPSLRLADAAMASGAPDLALRVADLMIARNPRDLRALIARGDALYAMGQRDLAQAAYRAAVAIDPTVAAGQLGLGRTLVRSDLPTAETAFLAALRSEPDNVLALNNLGVALDMQGRNAEAQEAYRKALRFSPESTDIRVNLGMSLALSGNTSDAVPLLREVAADPNAAQTWRKELISALTTAGDGAWARQALNDNMVQRRLSPDNERATTRSTLASLPSGRAADRSISHEPKQEPPSSASKLPDEFEAPESLTANAPATLKVAAQAAASRVALAESEPPPKLAMPTDWPALTPKPVVAQAARPAISADPVPSQSGAIGAPIASIAAPTLRTAAAPPTALTSMESAEHSGTLSGEPFVQLASLLSESDATFEWRRLSGRLSEVLDGLEPMITPADVGGRKYWRLRAFGFAGMQDAKDLCGELKEAGWDCLSGREP